MLRYFTAGESHGPCLTAIIEGLPSNLPISVKDIDAMLARRQGGYGRGGRMKIETDKVTITGGVRGGLTLGSPVAMVIENKDWQNWQENMSPMPDADLDQRVVSRPRPGHADLPGGIKYGQKDMRNILERSSARETAARVAVGAVCKQLLSGLGVNISGHVTQIGSVKAQDVRWEDLYQAVESPLYCADAVAEQLMMAAIDKAKQDGDTLGGVFEVRVKGLPPGLGSHVHWDRRLDGLLAQALMSIQAIKGVEVGIGFTAAALPGTQVHDEIYYSPDKGIYRHTNNAGGIEGGLTNGEELAVRAAMKPIPTLMQPLESINIDTKEAEQAVVERSDVCAVPAASVVGEAVIAITLAGVVLEHFGADQMKMVSRRWRQWWEYVESF